MCVNVYMYVYTFLITDFQMLSPFSIGKKSRLTPFPRIRTLG